METFPNSLSLPVVVFFSTQYVNHRPSQVLSTLIDRRKLIAEFRCFDCCGFVEDRVVGQTANPQLTETTNFSNELAMID